MSAEEKAIRALTIQQQVIDVLRDNGKPMSPVAMLGELPEEVTEDQLRRAVLSLQQKGTIARIQHEGSKDALSRRIAAWALVAGQ